MAVEAGLARRALAWLWRFVAATIAATAATAPLVAHHFGEVAPLSPLGNLALVPIVELAVVPVGLAGAAAGALWAPLGKLPLAAAGFAAKGTLAVASAFRAHGPLWLCRTPNLLETAALTGAGCLALIAAGRARPARRAAGVGGARGGAGRVRQPRDPRPRPAARARSDGDVPGHRTG